MSAAESERTFKQSIIDVADLYEEAYGLQGAIEELQSQRRPGEETPRVNETLAVLKRRQENHK